MIKVILLLTLEYPRDSGILCDNYEKNNQI